MASYRQYCPIARATELLAERWTLLVVRNMMFGARTFTEIARGVPAMSRSMLVKRLREMERDGLIVVTPKPNGAGSTYALSAAGADLVAVLDALGGWGTRWADITSEHTDPGFALWAWVQVQLKREALPGGRVVVSFTFPDQPSGNRRFWLLIEHGDAEVCYSEPGSPADVEITAESRAFIDWHRGALSWTDAVRAGRITASGRRPLVRAVPTWNRRAPVITT